MIGQWRIGRTIGKGSSGRVKIAKHSITGKYAAIKIVPKGLILTSRMSVSEAGARADKVLLGIEREIVIMKLIDHPNVLKLYDVWETSGELFLIMEYVPGGELFDYLVKRGRLPELEALQYFQQIIHAVDYCHRFNICHRDLKPENLLLDKDKNIKVADFGMAAWQAGERMLETSCGSPHYASPEIVAGKAYDGSASDIWSCGIILFALITGRLPFDDDNIRVLLLKVKTGIFEMPSEVQGPVRDLLFRMLEKDPRKRITMPEILSHPFFVSAAPKGIPGRTLIPPPSLDEVERPVNSAEEIEEDIMGNLKTLWHGAPDEDIIKALLSPEKTWEKAIYHLLIKYRNRHLENYNEEEPADVRPVQNQPEPSHKATRNPLGEASSSQGKANRGNPALEMPRPQAPTPTKAQGKVAPVTLGPSVQERMAKLNLRSVPQGPRPLVSPRASYQSQASGTGAQEEGTPDALHTPRAVADNGSDQLLAIQVPMVENEAVQKFFDEVAQQLNNISVRSSVISTSSQRSGSGPGPVATSSRVEQGDNSRFADADDDESDILIPYSPAVDNDTFSVNSYMFGPASSINDNRNVLSTPAPSIDLTRQSSMVSAGPSSRRQSHHYDTFDRSALTTETFSATRAAPPPLNRPAFSRPLAPEDRPHATAPPAMVRDASYVYIEMDDSLKSEAWNSSVSSRGSQGISSKWNEATKARKKKGLSVQPTPFVPTGGVQLESPKRSWFQNLFNFKPAPFTLWSYESMPTTARAIQHRLTILGARVAVERHQDTIMLRCKADHIKVDGRTQRSEKPVYFKVEVMRAMPPSNYSTGASLTLVKGAHSTFKEICEVLRRSYTLDNLDVTPVGSLKK